MHNCRGINRINKFNSLLNKFKKLKNMPKIIALCETKLEKSFSASIYNLKNYNQFACCREKTSTSKVVGGGLLLFIHKAIVITDHKMEKLNQIEKIVTQFSIDREKFKLIFYYRAPDNDKKLFFNDLEKEVYETDEKIIILGDINLNKNDCVEYINLLNSYGLEIVNTHTTREASGKIIDHIIINFRNSIHYEIDTIKWDDKQSDHNAIMSTFKTISINKPKYIRKEVKRINEKKFKEIFTQEKAKSNLLTMTCPNEIADEISKMVSKARDLSTCTSIISYKYGKNNFIITKKLEYLFKKKDNMRKQNKRNFNAIRKDKIDQISLQIKHEIKKARNELCQKLISERDGKKLWKNLNEILGKDKKKNVIELIHDGKTINDEREIADTLNNIFISKVQDTKQNIEQTNANYQTPNIAQSMVINEVSQDDIFYAINELNTQSSPGFDNITAKQIKIIKFEIADLLCHLTNQIFQSGKYPDLFKRSIVIPINKSGKYNDPFDYRGVSMLSILNKIVEKILHKKIFSFVNGNKLLYGKQYGFRPNSNTEIAAVELVDHVKSLMDSKRKVSLTSTDLSIAFDVVEHKKLMHTLNCYGLRGVISQIINDFLSNRVQIVRVGETLSQEKNIEHGVIQGSSLGPLLFLLFFNTISHLQLNGTLFLYADDAIIVNSCKKNECIEDYIKKDMMKIIHYLKSQGLVLNANKSNYMVFGTHDNDIPNQIEIDDSNVLCRVHETKYLGLIIDQRLKWDAHVNYLKKKISSASGILYRLRKVMPIRYKKLIYHTLIGSHLNYMNVIWGTANDNIIKDLQTLQNRALRNVFNLDPRCNRVAMYTHLIENILPIRAINFVNTSGMIYKIIHKKLMSNLIFEWKTIGRITRNKKRELKVVNAKSTFGSRRIVNYGSKIFNATPTDIQNLPHFHAFKWALKCSVRKEEFIEACLSHSFLHRFES
jgi:hypothetical protein